MQSQNPFFDDIARVAGGALGALSGLRAEMEAMIRQQMERFTSSADMVSREEFEVVRDMAAKARAEQEALEARITLLEARLAELGGKAAAKQPAASKQSAPKAAKPRVRKVKPKDESGPGEP